MGNDWKTHPNDFGWVFQPKPLKYFCPVFHWMWIWIMQSLCSMECAVLAGSCWEVFWLRCTLFVFFFFKAIWRDWSLSDRRRPPVCCHHVQVERRGGAGERRRSWRIWKNILMVSHTLSVGSFSFSTTCKAALHGAKFKTQTLRLAWHKAVTAVRSEDPDEAEPEDDEVCERLWIRIYHP